MTNSRSDRRNVLVHSRIALTRVAVVLAVTSATLIVDSHSSSATASGTLSFFAGNGSTGAPTAGPALNSPYSGPESIAIDASDNVYASDSNEHVVTKITPGGTQSIFAGNGAMGSTIAGPATSTHVASPTAIAFDPSGNLYIADNTNNVIDKVTPSGTLSIFAGNGSMSAPIPGPATSSPVSEPSGLAIDGAGNVYVGAYGSYQILKITPSGTLSVFAGNGSYGQPTAGPALSSPTGGTFGLAVDTAGNVYMNDYDFCAITKITPSGTQSILAGTGTCAAEIPGPAASSPLGYLYGSLTVDAQNNVYFGDSSNYTFGKISASGTLSIIAGTPGVNATPTAGPALSSSIETPYSVAFDSHGVLYLIDRGAHQILKLTGLLAPSAPTGAVAALSGGNVSLSWSAPTTGGTTVSYTVRPIVNGVAGTPVSGITALTYTVSSPVAGATYAFSITADNAAGSSNVASSNTVTVASAPTTTVPPTTTTTTAPPTTTTVVPPAAGISAPIHVATDGTVTDVPVFNSPTPAKQITVSTPSGQGSWTLAPDGGVFTAGEARFYGSHGGSPMNAPAVGITPTASGGGYLIVGADGGVFAYGDAKFQGSMGGLPLNKPITGIGASCSKDGYYLVAGEGGVFGFGSAGFYGSMAGRPLNQNMLGIVDSCGQNGYWTFAKDGGVFTFGNANFYGSLASNPPAGGVIGMVSAADGKGYWLIGADKKAYGFGSVG